MSEHLSSTLPPESEGPAKDVIMIHSENFWARQKALGMPYFLLTEHLWRLNAMPASDEECARIAKITVQAWLAIKPTVWPKILAHDEEWFFCDHKRSDEIMEKQAAEAGDEPTEEVTDDERHH